MWKDILEKFDKYPSQQKIIRKMLELGLKVDEDKKIYCKDVEINISSLAKSVDTDRRVVTSTIENILKDDILKNIFTNIYSSGALLTNLSDTLGLGVIEIEGEANKPGILSKVTELLAYEKISIRQAYASDPEIDLTPHLTIITDKPVNGDLIQLLLKIEGVSKVSLY
ncbi:MULTISPECIES: regulator of aminoacid metabolism [Methanosphaera]|uniref:Predicted regulator of aminoacid metabolism n=1 Tax=Methanosphaera stadtmanae (strain ATCC 43021 / DSM 3091 / JCM 11832 / MCB-3) TaxID=339860 RepID=Q2NFF1_METST|nr:MULTISPECIES: regulator of aminoacid metabolism [Methanosphaera]ABC57452.1 predicted regulator of aminoacid metabolism [Methanosphaera stadtmanae DSM 3091]OEC85354.1 amino acid-binding protein [Methanosphaera sp. A6]